MSMTSTKDSALKALRRTKKDARPEIHIEVRADTKAKKMSFMMTGEEALADITAAEGNIEEEPHKPGPPTMMNQPD